MIIYPNFSLRAHNSFQLNVSARYFAEYYSVQELVELLSSDLLKENRFLQIGGGCNLLFINDFDGVILHSGIKGIEFISEDDKFIRVRVGAGEVWDNFVQFAVEQNFGGIENLSHIPSEVGAAPIQNIGAYGAEAKNVIEAVETIEIATGKKRVFSNEECHFGYRNSVFKHELKDKYIVIYVVFKFEKQPQLLLNYGNLREEVLKRGKPSIKTVREAVIAIRQSKLPDHKTIGNAGSFFMNPVISIEKLDELKTLYPDIPSYALSAKNPFSPLREEGKDKPLLLHNNTSEGEVEVKIPAAWLIEQCGWKGKSLGNAAVHDKQALVLINKGNATGVEIMHLATEITKSVEAKFGIKILLEIIVV